MPKLRVIIKPPPEPQGEPEQQVEALRDYLLQMSEELAYVLTHLEADNINDSTFERIQGMIPRPYTGLPVMDGDASSGQSEGWSRGDHRHPKDTSKADVTALETEAAAREAHEDDTSNPHEVTKAQVGLGNVANERQYSAQNPPPIPTPVEVGAIAATEKGSAGGVAELDSSGHVPSGQLPSYVDDVLEYPSITDFPIPGESGKIYLAIDTNLFYRWGGTTYGPTNPSLALGETSETAYRGDRGKIAYDHSQTTGNPHGTTAAEVGARPDNWTPSAADVGARPDNWVPDAEDVPYDNTQSGLMATDVQAAIDELAQGGGGGTAASAVSYDNTGSGLAATNVQDAIDEVYGDIPTQASDIGAQDEITANGILKGNGAGGVSAAVAGTDYATPSQLEDKANQDQLAPVQNGATATRGFSIGELFNRNGTIYRVTSPISVGGTFTPGTNCTPTDLGTEIFGLGFRSWFPNGQSMQSVPSGTYRTAPTSVPSEGLPGNQYGALLIMKSGYPFVVYIGVNGNMGIWESNASRWRTIASTPV